MDTTTMDVKLDKVTHQRLCLTAGRMDTGSPLVGRTLQHVSPHCR